MGLIHVWTCDECGHQKKPTEQWFMLAANGSNVMLFPFDEGTAATGAACSRECLHKAIERWAETVTYLLGERPMV